MSALAGVWHPDGRPGAEEDCRRMLAAQAIYAPHGTRCWSQDGLALGRGLYRLLPEDRNDAQPLTGGGGRFALVADVRLDNREELAGLLGFSPQRAHGLCDAEFLLAAIERWGERCHDHLLGDYAFALWDVEKRHLLLARSPLEAKPLFYHRGPDFFAFASMPKGLLALPGSRARPTNRNSPSTSC